MRIAVPLAFAALVLGSNIPVHAQSNRPGGVTTLVMGADTGNGVIPALPGSRVRVPPLEQVKILAPEGWPLPAQWMKDGKPILGATGSSYTIPFATSADSGRYGLAGALPPGGAGATGIDLDVVLPGHLANFSMRVELNPGAGATQTAGFVVVGKQPKLFLVRAVGPSLKAFGLTKVVARPQFRYFDSKGAELVFVYPAIALNWDIIFRAAGAFPLGENGDSYNYVSLAPGAYTIQVSDAQAAGGTVLLEIYELPSSALQEAAGIAVVVPPSP